MSGAEYLLFAATGSVAGLSLAALSHIWTAWRRSAEIHAKITNAALAAVGQRADADASLRVAGGEILTLTADNARLRASVNMLRRAAEAALHHNEHEESVLYAEAMAELARVVRTVSDVLPASKGIHERDTEIPPSA